MLTIGINAFYVRWGVNGGTETYLTNIVRPWYTQRVEKFHFILYCSALPPWWTGNRAWFSAIVLPMATNLIARLFCEQIYIAFASFSQFDILFSPGYVGNIFIGLPQVVTVHDLYGWLYSSEVGRLRSVYWRILLSLTLRRNCFVISVSNSTAKDFFTHISFPSSKVCVVHEAGDHLLKPTNDHFPFINCGLAVGTARVGLVKQATAEIG